MWNQRQDHMWGWSGDVSFIWVPLTDSELAVSWVDQMWGIAGNPFCHLSSILMREGAHRCNGIHMFAWVRPETRDHPDERLRRFPKMSHNDAHDAKQTNTVVILLSSLNAAKKPRNRYRGLYLSNMWLLSTLLNYLPFLWLWIVDFFPP